MLSKENMSFTKLNVIIYQLCTFYIFFDDLCIFFIIKINDKLIVRTKFSNVWSKVMSEQPVWSNYYTYHKPCYITN